MIGQSQVTDPLMTALRTGRVGHAYLFSGPRGCGKTTSARILARCLNCAEGPTDTPCGTCPSCVELSRAGGGSLDVVEIDAASHGGVDDARDLRERAVFAPARDRFKIFIIDEAHMVTAGGFNALLKIVEEPPPHVKFIFATTEPEKVIGTIRSRTHHYPFRLIPPATLVDYVQSLCDSEGVSVEPGVLPLVVRSGGGSVRDTLSILDQLIAGSEGDSVSAERAAGLLGFTHGELLDDVVAALGAQDAAAAFTATDRVIQTGQDPRRFVEDLLERLRDLIIVNATTVDGAAAVLRGVPQDQLTRMFEQARAFGAHELSLTADTVSDALDQMTGATPPRLHLELMIARALVGLAGTGASAGAGVPAGAGAPVGAGAGAPVGAGAPAGAPGRGAQTPGAPAAQRPAQPQQAAPAQAPGAAPANAAQAGPAQAPAAQQQPAAAPERVANAAETAASIREFLRAEDSGGAAEQAQRPTQQDPGAPGPQPAQGQQRPAQGQQADRQAPHPNEGAASFGRPISDVLSASQIESIGTDSGPSAAGAQQPAQSQAQPAQAPAPGADGVAAAQQGQGAGAPEQPAAPVADAPAAADQGAAAAQAAGAAAAQPMAGVAPAQPADGEAGAEAEDSVQPGFEDLREMWPELLDELLETNRDAWNAVRPIEPLGLEGDLLIVGVSNRSDLDAFKSVGAGPLRETILESTGVRVRYAPRQVSGSREQREQQQSAGSPDSEEPHRAGQPQAQTQTPGGASPAALDANDPVARAAARLSALGPALAAPAWADPVESTPAAPAAPSAPAAAAPSSEAAPVAAAVPEAPTGAPQPNPEAAPGAAVHPAPAPQDRAAPAVAGTAAPRAGSAGRPSAPSQPDFGGDPGVPDYPSDDDDPYDDPYAGADRGSYGAAPSAPSQASARQPAPQGGHGQAAPASASAASARAPEAPAPTPGASAPGQPGPSQPAPGQPAPAQSAPGQPAPGQPTSAPGGSGPVRPGGAPGTAPGSASPSTPAGPAAQAAPGSPAPKTAPAFTRYGEAVVREVLGAVFIEERPLPAPRR